MAMTTINSNRVKPWPQNRGGIGCALAMAGRYLLFKQPVKAHAVEEERGLIV
jgi:hypothetical protein